MSTSLWYVYKTCNRANGKIYVGVHKSDDISNDRYVGSGKALHAAIKKYGYHNFSREILFECVTPEDAYELESLIVDSPFCNREDTYNMSLGGAGSKYRKPNNTSGAKTRNNGWRIGLVCFFDAETGNNYWGREVPNGFSKGMFKRRTGVHAYNLESGERKHFHEEVPEGWEVGHNWSSSPTLGKVMGHREGETRFFDSAKELEEAGFARGNDSARQALIGKVVATNPSTKEVLFVEDIAALPPVFFQGRLSKHANFFCRRKDAPNVFYCMQYGNCPELDREEWIIGLPKFGFGRFAVAEDNSHFIRVDGASPTSKTPPKGYKYASEKQIRATPSALPHSWHSPIPALSPTSASSHVSGHHTRRA